MAHNTRKHSSLNRKAAAAVVSGLMVLGMAPVAPFAQALAAENDVVVEDAVPLVVTDETTIRSQGADGMTAMNVATGVNLAEADVAPDPKEYTYNGEKCQPKATVSKDGDIVADEDYDITYADNCIDAQESVSFTIKAKDGNQHGIIGQNEGTYPIKPASLATSMIALSADSVTANGEVQKPTITVNDLFTKAKLVEGIDYEVDYGEGDYKAVGTYTIKVTALKNFMGTISKTFTINEDVGAIPVTGKAHVQRDGDKNGTPTPNGVVLGTTGQSKRIEAMSLKLGTDTKELGIEYRSHVQGIGWESGWAANGAASGTTGQSKRLEAMQLRLTGSQANDYEVFYRVHAQTYGWLGWTKNGEPAGTAGQSKRLEAIEVCVLPKGKTPQDYDAKQPAFTGRVTGVAHVQTYGTLEPTTGIIGTTGESKRIESIRLSVSSQPYEGGIEYQSHVQTYGWEQNWASDGSLSGTEGQSKRLEAMRVRLTGDLADHFDVWYRVHSRRVGWGGWAKNGEDAGTQGMSLRAEAIQIEILSKDAAAPGPTQDALRVG